MDKKLIQNAYSTSYNTRLRFLIEWFQMAEGSAILQFEKRTLQEQLQNLFGYHALQMTVTPDQDFFRLNKIRNVWLLSLLDELNIYNQLWDKEKQKQDFTIQVDPLNLGVVPNGVDLALLHHVHEFSEFPHRMVNQMARTVASGGKLVVVGFNPNSFLSLYRQLIPRYRKLFRHSYLISISRMQDWLALLGFRVDSVILGSVVFPLSSLFKSYINKSNLVKYSWFASSYIIIASQTSDGVIPIHSFWYGLDRVFNKHAVGLSSNSGIIK